MLSIIVSHTPFLTTWILFLILIFFLLLFYFDVKFCPTDWKHVGHRMKIGNRKWWSFLWSNTVPYLSCQVQIPPHCLISMILPVLGWSMKCMKHENRLVLVLLAKVKRLAKITWWQANYEQRLHFFEDISILLWHITTITHNLY